MNPDPASRPQGRILVEANGPITFPTNSHNTGGAQGSSSQAATVKKLLGSSKTDVNVIANGWYNNGYRHEVESNPTVNNLLFRYNGQEVTVTKAGGETPTFTMRPQNTGLVVKWDECK